MRFADFVWAVLGISSGIFIMLMGVVEIAFAYELNLTIEKDSSQIKIFDKQNTRTFGVGNFTDDFSWEVDDCAELEVCDLSNVSASIDGFNCSRLTEDQVKSVVQERLVTFQGDFESFFEPYATDLDFTSRYTRCEKSLSDVRGLLDDRAINESRFQNKLEVCRVQLDNKEEITGIFGWGFGITLFLVLLLLFFLVGGKEAWQRMRQGK